MICDGSAISRTTYSDLFSKIGTTYGSGDGSTTFNIPNIKGRVIVGKDSSQTEFDTLGKTGGDKNMQKHSHTGSTGEGKTSMMRAVAAAGGGYAHNHVPGYSSASYQDFTGGSSDYPGANHYHDFTTNETGTGQSGNLQPYIVINYIIKVGATSIVPQGIAELSNSYTESNINGYTAEYINNLHSYSSEEQRIGTWFGEPLYRKVVQVTTTSGSDIRIAGSTISANLKEIINLSGRTVQPSGNVTPIPFYINTADYTNLFWNDDTNGKRIHLLSGSNSGYGTAYVYVDYTKTTD